MSCAAHGRVSAASSGGKIDETECHARPECRGDGGRIPLFPSLSLWGESPRFLVDIGGASGIVLGGTAAPAAGSTPAGAFVPPRRTP